MNYDKLSAEDIESYEKQLIEKADNLWVKMFGKEETNDIEKLRLLSRQGMIQDKFQHDIMTGYFKKQGLSSDGRTTLQEKEKQLTLKKTEFGIKIQKIKDSRTRDIDEIIERAKAKKKELNQIPDKLKDKYKVDRNAILEKLHTDLEAFYERAEQNIEKDITDVYDNFIKNVKARQDDLLAKARQDIKNLQTQCKNKMITEVEYYSAELEAELQVLDNVENDEQLIKRYEEEIRKINQEINELRDVPISVEEIRGEPEPERFPCPFYGQDDCDHEPFINKGGLGGHIYHVHGTDKFNEYKQAENNNNNNKEVSV